jgi:hypothetical protein
MLLSVFLLLLLSTVLVLVAAKTGSCQLLLVALWGQEKLLLDVFHFLLSFSGPYTSASISYCFFCEIVESYSFGNWQRHVCLVCCKRL